MKKIFILLSFILIFLSGCNITEIQYNESINVSVTGQLDTVNNFWNNTATGVNGESNIVDTMNYPHISIISSTSGATTLSVYVSSDGTNFYLCEDLTTKINVPTGRTTHIFFTAGARYFKLISSNNIIINASINAKP